MMMRILLIVISLCIQGFCLAQEILWAKQFAIGNRQTEITSFFQKPDSSFVSACLSFHLGYRTPITLTTYYGTAVVFHDKYGDTLKVVNLRTTGWYNPKITSSVFGEIFVGVSVPKDTLLNSKMRVYKLDAAGNTVWMRPFIQGYESSMIRKIRATSDGGCMILGYANSIFLPNAYRDWFLIKLSFSGEIEWSQRYSGGGTSECNNIEPMVGGNFLLSGMADQKIWSVVINQNGDNLSNHYFYSSPNPYLMYQANVIQLPENRFLASGNQWIGDNYVTYTGMYNSAKAKIWENSKLKNMNQPWASADGGFVRSEFVRHDSVYVRKYMADSTIDWSVTIGPENRCQINDLIYDGYGSAYLCGYIETGPVLNSIDQGYIIKVSNVGLPFDTTSNRSLDHSHYAEKPLAYPNPCQQVLFFKNVFRPFQLEIFDLRGIKMAGYQVRPGEGIPVWSLPKGNYAYKLLEGNKIAVGRFIKE